MLATKFANVPFDILILSFLLSVLVESNLPASSQRSKRLEKNCIGVGFGVPLTVNKLETPIALFTFRHGAASDSILTNM